MAILLPALPQINVYQPSNPEGSGKWQISPAKNIKAGMGRLNLNFPPGTEWSVDIYSGSRFIINRSIETYKLKYHELAPGTYSFKLNTVMVENVPVEAGKITTLLTGLLEISSNDWELRTESNQKFLTSGNTPKKLVLPVGKYQLTEGTNNKLVEVKTNATINPQVLVDDQFQYIMSPVTGSTDTALTTRGRLNLEFPLASSLFETFELVIVVYNKTDNTEVYRCPSPFPCHGYQYLPEGNYYASVNWHHPYGAVTPIHPVMIWNLPIKKGFETRIKAGYIRNLTKGTFLLYNETKETDYWSYKTQTAGTRALPVGKYILQTKHAGEHAIEITDGKVFSFTPIPADAASRPKYKIVRSKQTLLKTGRLICEFPNADTVFLTVFVPNKNGGVDAVKPQGAWLELSPGTYNVKLANVTFPVKIEVNKDTHLLFGYVRNNLDKPILLCDALNINNCSFLYGKKTMPLPVGYHYFKSQSAENPSTWRYELFKLTESGIEQQ